MLVRRNAFKPFKHFVAFDNNSAFARASIRQNTAPNRMRVQYCACSFESRNRDVQQSFSRSAAFASDNFAFLINLQYMLAVELAFIQAACRDCEPQRIALYYRAEVAASPKHPAAPVKLSPDLGNLGGKFGKIFCLFFHQSALLLFSTKRSDR